MSPSHAIGSRQRNDILQHGFDEPAPETCPAQDSALLFQAKVVGLVVSARVVLKAPAIFLALGGLLWRNAHLARWNPFDALDTAS